MSRYVDLDDDRICFCGEEGDYYRYNIPIDDMEYVDIIHCGQCRFVEFTEKNNVARCKQLDKLVSPYIDFCSRAIHKYYTK